MSNSPLLPEFSLPLYDHRTIFARRVGARKLVYLDHNAWIELRDLRTPRSAACLAVCHAAVERQKAIFPLAFPAVTEAIEIPDRATRLRHADLLDALSNGVTFRAPPILFNIEAEQACRWLINDEEVRVSREDIFTSLPYVASEGAITFPAGWTVEQVAQFIAALTDEPVMRRCRTLRYMAEQRDWGLEHAPMRKRYVHEMEQTRQRRLAAEAQPKQAAFAQALLDEREALVKHYLIPALTSVLLAEVGPRHAIKSLVELIARKGEGGKRRVGDLFAKMPIMDQHARLFALDAMEKARRPQPQDFYDVEHGTAAPIYADAFVTFDKRLARLVTNAGRGAAELVTSLVDLECWIEQHCAG